MTRKRHVHLSPDTPIEDARALVAAERNAPDSQEAVRALLARDPAWLERLGTIAEEAESAIVSQVGRQVLVQEAARAELNQMRMSLNQPGDGALERLLVERVVLCWLGLHSAEIQRARRIARGKLDDSIDVLDRHVSRLHGDFLRATKTLASARRLRVAAVQVHVVQQHVNLAG